jgi:hypothetical protein
MVGTAMRQNTGVPMAQEENRSHDTKTTGVPGTGTGRRRMHYRNEVPNEEEVQTSATKMRTWESAGFQKQQEIRMN